MCKDPYGLEILAAGRDPPRTVREIGWPHHRHTRVAVSACGNFRASLSLTSTRVNTF